MIRRGLLAGMITVFAMLALVVPAASARSAPNGEVIPQSWLLGHLNDADARGIVAVRDGVDADNWTFFTLIGLRPGANYRMVLSPQTCGHPSVDEFRLPFTANSKGERSVATKLKLEKILVSSLRSVRVRWGKPSGYQTVACAPLRLYDLIDPQGNSAALREHARPRAAGGPEVDTLLTIFREPGAKGIIVHGMAGNDEVRVRAVVTGLAASTGYILLGGVAGCGAPWSKPERAARVKFDTNSRGQARIDASTPLITKALTGDTDGNGTVDGRDFLAWRIKRATGQSVGCYAVDTPLSRHQP